MTRRATAESLLFPPAAPVSGTRAVEERPIGWPSGAVSSMPWPEHVARTKAWLRVMYPDEPKPGAFRRTEDDEMTGEEVKVMLAELSRRPLPKANGLTWRDLADQVSIERGVTLLDIIGRSRMKSAAGARHHLFGALRGAGYSYPEIAKVFGVDHTTVIHGTRKAAMEVFV